MTGLLAISEVSFAFGRMMVVDAVSFEIARGAVVGLVGPNGAGKSTLFSIVSGFITPERGAILYQGEDITRQKPERRARAGLVRTFQVPREFRTLTARENLAAALTNRAGESMFGLFLRPGAVRREEQLIAERVERMIAICGLGAVADLPSVKLSGGQKKLLELGRAAILEPELLLLDEPFNGVNPVLIEKLSEAILELNGRGTTILVVEHNLVALERVAPLFHVMDRGRLIASGTPAAVLADEAVRAAYLGSKDSRRVA